jgi:hypothetical protein
MHSVRLMFAAWCCACGAGCAGAMVQPKVAAPNVSSEALIVLPGFGYNHGGEQALRRLAPSMAAQGIDLFVPTFVSRAGLAESREHLRRLILANHFDRYDRVHVFAFIAGGWTLNPLVGTESLRNLSTVVYDRSPYQERAPRIAVERLPWLAWLKYGRVVFDVARTPYTPINVPRVRVGLVVETEPTRFIRRFAATARRYGPYDFACDALTQPFDDCLYVPLDHGQLYTHFDEVWPEVLAFIRGGHFSESARRALPAGNEPASSH